jgi:hypothetical protein
MQRRALHGCGGREAPFGLDGLRNVAGENQRCAMLLCAFPSGPAIKSQSTCTSDGVASSRGAPFVRGWFWGPRAGVGIWGRTQRTFLHSGFPTGTKQLRVLLL